MSTLLLTLCLAFAIVIIAVGLLGIGWLVTGRARLQLGACGRAPHQKPGNECGTGRTCSLCEKESS